MTLYVYDVAVSAGFDFARRMAAARAYVDDHADADAAKATL
ncbi:hypothetical protein PQR14_01945 [Paraburkholderia bryophila]|nr:hypothetical protein [Burkholderia sp. 9120]